MSRSLIIAGLCLLAGWSWIDRPVVDVEDGNRAFARGEFQVAASKYEQALVEGTEPELLLNRGLALYRIGLTLSGAQRDETIRRAESAMSRASSSKRPWLRARALTGLGNLYLQRGDLSDAVAAYRRALRSDRDNRAARENLELALRRQAAKQDKAGEPDGAQEAGDPDGTTATPTADDPEQQPGPEQKPDASGDPDADKPVDESEPDVDQASPDAKSAGGPQPRGPESGGPGELSDLDRKLNSLERRSRGLRRELLGKRRDQASEGPPW